MSGKSSKFVCKFAKSKNCNKTFATLKEAIEHQEKEHMTNKYTCNYKQVNNSTCGKIFIRKRELDEHKEKAHGILKSTNFGNDPWIRNDGSTDWAIKKKVLENINEKRRRKEGSTGKKRIKLN